PVGGGVGGAADGRQVLEAVGDLALEALVARVDGEVGQVPGEPPDGGRVRAAVVVDDHYQVGRLEVGDLVQRLIGHPAGEGAVPDHRDHVAGFAAPQPRLGEAQRVAERGGGVAVLDPVVLALGPGRVT